MQNVDVAGTTLTGAVVPAPAADDELELGQLIGDFRLDDKLGEGRSCVVYSATHQAIGKRAAVKVMRRSLLGVPVAVEHFVREGSVANAISHQHVSSVFGFGHLEDGRPYILMEHLPGRTLLERLGEVPPTVAEVAQIGCQVGAGLEAVHAAGYVHGDIKPSNILLAKGADGSETIKLIDFGVASVAPAGELSEDERSPMVCGTLPYMAPEQRRGYAPRPASDVYSLGVLLYRLLVGRRPFEGADHSFASAESIRGDALVPPSEVVPGVPRDLSQLVVRMLSFDTAGRPPLSEVRELLTRCSAVTVRAGTAPLGAAGARKIPQVVKALPAQPDVVATGYTEIVSSRQRPLRQLAAAVATGVAIGCAVLILGGRGADSQVASDTHAPRPESVAPSVAAHPMVAPPQMTRQPLRQHSSAVELPAVPDTSRGTITAPAQQTALAGEPAVSAQAQAQAQGLGAFGSTGSVTNQPLARPTRKPRKKRAKKRSSQLSATPADSRAVPTRVTGDSTLDPFGP